MPAPQTPPTLTVRPRRRTWDNLKAQVGIDSDAALAALMGVTEATVQRVFAGKVDPSPKFIAHALHTFPFCGFREMFLIEPVTR